jgi:sarcosine oxidase subunit beta
MRFSALRLLIEAARGHRGWRPLWRDPAPQSAYD